jgi:DNA-binding LytR/AlgR family response regulator
MEYDSQTSRTSKQENPCEYPEKLIIHPENRVLSQPVAEIDYLTSAANYVNVYSGGRVLRTRSTFRAIERSLDPQKFGRVHRRTIVNFDRVKKFRVLLRGDYILTLRDGTEVKMSRRHREQLGKIVPLADAAGKPLLKYHGNGKKNRGPVPPSSVTEQKPLDDLALGEDLASCVIDD